MWCIYRKIINIFIWNCIKFNIYLLPQKKSRVFRFPAFVKIAFRAVKHSLVNFLFWAKRSSLNKFLTLGWDTPTVKVSYLALRLYPRLLYSQSICLHSNIPTFQYLVTFFEYIKLDKSKSNFKSHRDFDTEIEIAFKHSHSFQLYNS